ncbi:MAG TPA: hypothetical protein VEZ19_11340 [Rubrobacter sp.]|nr:hypothetical protein [Rubrobacter sp.]
MRPECVGGQWQTDEGWGRAIRVAIAFVIIVFIVIFVLRYLRTLGQQVAKPASS